jgi:hypothetical protein
MRIFVTAVVLLLSFAFFSAFHPSVIVEEEMATDIPATRVLDAMKDLSGTAESSEAAKLLHALGIQTSVSESLLDAKFGKIEFLVNQDKIQLQTSFLDTQTADKIELFNADGQKVFAEDLPQLTAYEIPAHYFEAGVYTYKLMMGQDMFVGRFLLRKS